MERWNVGILGIGTGESRRFGLGTLRLRIAEARGKELLAFSLKSAEGGRSYNLFQGNVAMSDFSGDLLTSIFSGQKGSLYGKRACG